MALIFERIQTAGIAELSYLIGDDMSGAAAVIDPRADVETYVELALKHSLPSPMPLKLTSIPTW